MRDELTAFRALFDVTFPGRVSDAVRRRADGEYTRDNYIVLFPAIPELGDDRYLVTQTAASGRLFTLDARVVAVDSDGALWYADKLFNTILGTTLTVPGRRCTPIVVVPNPEEGTVNYDRATDLYFLNVSFRFSSRAA